MNACGASVEHSRNIGGTRALFESLAGHVHQAVCIWMMPVGLNCRVRASVGLSCAQGNSACLYFVNAAVSPSPARWSSIAPSTESCSGNVRIRFRHRALLLWRH